MSDESPILSYINRFIPLTAAEADQFVSAFRKVRIKKRQFIVQPDFPVKHRYYITKGSLRAYVVSENGQEHTVSLAIEDWWITDYIGYILQQPATMFVVAFEDTEALELDYKKEQELKAANHKFETFFRIIAERGLVYHQKRLVSNLTETAEERYRRLMEKYPLLIQRIPQYALASFLGMSTEYLSKLRKKQSPRLS